MAYLQIGKAGVEIKKVKRSPLGGFLAWCVKKAAGTLLEKPIALITKSKIACLAGGIISSLAIGALIDLVFHFSILHECVILGALAGAGAQGAGGGFLGALWGWFVGTMTGTLFSELTLTPMASVAGKLAAWCAASLSGWFVGRITAWLFHKLPKKYQSLLAIFFITAFLCCIVVLIFQIWKLAATNTDVIMATWSSVKRWTLLVGRWTMKILIALVWVIVIIFWFENIENGKLQRNINLSLLSLLKKNRTNIKGYPVPPDQLILDQALQYIQYTYKEGFAKMDYEVRYPWVKNPDQTVIELAERIKQLKTLKDQKAKEDEIILRVEQAQLKHKFFLASLLIFISLADLVAAAREMIALLRWKELSEQDRAEFNRLLEKEEETLLSKRIYPSKFVRISARYLSCPYDYCPKCYTEMKVSSLKKEWRWCKFCLLAARS